MTPSYLQTNYRRKKRKTDSDNQDFDRKQKMGQVQNIPVITLYYIVQDQSTFIVKDTKFLMKKVHFKDSPFHPCFRNMTG